MRHRVAQQQVDQCRLAGSVAPTMPRALARLHLERHVAQDEVRLVGVGRANANQTCSNTTWPARRSGATHRRRGRAFDRSNRLVRAAKIRSEEAIAAWRMLNFSDISRDRPEEPPGVRERRPAIRASGSLQHPPAAATRSSAPRRARRCISDRRVKDGVVEDRVDVRRPMPSLMASNRVRARLAPEELHGRHPGDVLLQVADPRDEAGAVR